MKIKPWFIQMLFDGEGGDGGSGAGGAAGEGGGGGKGLLAAALGAGGDKGGEGDAGKDGDAGKGGDGNGAGDAANAYYPEGLADTFRGKDDRETIDKLAGHLKGLPQPPKEAKEYTFKPTDKLAPFFGQEKDNQVLDAFRDVSLKHGLAQSQFEGVINEFYGTLIEKGLMQTPVTLDAEFQKLGGSSGDPASQIRKGQERMLELGATFDALAASKQISADQAGALKAMAMTAGDVVALERVLSLIPGAQGPKNGGERGGRAGMSKADVLKRMEDPRYVFNSGQFSQGFYDETERLYAQVAGTG